MNKRIIHKTLFVLSSFTVGLTASILYSHQSNKAQASESAKLTGVVKARNLSSAVNTEFTGDTKRLQEKPLVVAQLDGGKASEGATRNDADNGNEKELEVQAVLTAKDNIVVSSLMDGVLVEFPFKNGDEFEKGMVLARLNCRFEEGKLQEIESRLRASSRQLEAYDRLKGKDAVAEVDYSNYREEREQLKALLKQAKAKVDLCVIKAPFDGHVTDSTASNYESVRAGRVLMQISSSDSLQAELMIPSIWLRWIKPGTPLKVVVHETGESYDAEVIRIHGQVDPVTRTIQIVAKVIDTSDELLPGMSGTAIFEKSAAN